MSQIQALPSEREYLLSVAQHYFPSSEFEVVDVITGLRVFKRSRDTVLLANNEDQPRLVSIYGGKLTVFRATADKVLQKLKRTLPYKKLLKVRQKLL